MDNLNRIVKRQFEEIEKCVIGTGEFVYRDDFKFFHVLQENGFSCGGFNASDICRRFTQLLWQMVESLFLALKVTQLFRAIA